MLLVLTGCVQIDKATGKPIGPVWDFLGAPMGEAIKYFATDKGLGFGVAIIIVTIIVRLIILPLGIYQSWKATLHSEKMNALKHVLEPHQNASQRSNYSRRKTRSPTSSLCSSKRARHQHVWRRGMFPYPHSNAFLLCYLLCCPTY